MASSVKKLPLKSRNGGLGASLTTKPLEEPYQTKITHTFQHCGLGYSPYRQGLLVVDNNAVNQKPITINTDLSKSQEKISWAPADKLKIQKEAFIYKKVDKVNKNISAIKEVQ